MNHLFSSDLDGTLLNRDHKTDRTILKGMEKINGSGSWVVPTTGRPKVMTKALDFPEGPLICSNGAAIYDENGTNIRMVPLDRQLIEAMIDEFPDMPFEFCTEDSVLTMHPLQRTIQDFEERWARRNKPRNRMDFEKMFASHKSDCTKEEILEQTILKINCNRNDEDPLNQQFQAWLKDHPGIINTPSDNVLYELTDKDANKGRAVQILAEHYGIEEHNVHTFGDGENDVSMLVLFDSYAPDNGDATAIHAAKHLLDSSDEYCVIHKMLELNAQ